MTEYYLVEPEVAGGFGDSTVMDVTVHPPQVSTLDYRVEDWLGDCIVTSFPCFLLVRSTATKFEAANFTGFRLASAIVSEGDQYRIMNPDGILPDLVWLQVNGTPGEDDLGIVLPGDLIVSSRVLDVLRQDGLNFGSYAPWTPDSA